MYVLQRLLNLLGVFIQVCFLHFFLVEMSSKSAVEDNDFVMPREDTAADVVWGTQEEKA